MLHDLHIGEGRNAAQHARSQQLLTQLCPAQAETAAPLRPDPARVRALLEAARPDRAADAAARLRERGVRVDVAISSEQSASWAVHPSPIAAMDMTVEPDLSNAAPFLAAAMVTRGSVTIPDWPSRTTQPGAQLPALLESMGATTSLGADGLTVNGPDQLLGLNANLKEVGELTPVLAALCAVATTESHISGIAHLRGHETDRLEALATEINRVGGNATETEDGLVIKPAALHGADVESYDDHRMATAGAVIGLVVDGVRVEDIGTTAKTLPNFDQMWSDMLSQDNA
mgnify:CR=1 FL=1